MSKIYCAVWLLLEKKAPLQVYVIFGLKITFLPHPQKQRQNVKKKNAT